MEASSLELSLLQTFNNIGVMQINSTIDMSMLHCKSRCLMDLFAGNGFDFIREDTLRVEYKNDLQKKKLLICLIVHY